MLKIRRDMEIYRCGTSLTKKIKIVSDIIPIHLEILFFK